MKRRFSTPSSAFGMGLPEPSPIGLQAAGGSTLVREVISTSRTMTAISGMDVLDSTEEGAYSPMRPAQHLSNVSLLLPPASSTSRCDICIFHYLLINVFDIFFKHIFIIILN